MADHDDVGVCEPNEWRGALQLLYGDLSDDECERQIDQVLGAAESGTICLDGLAVHRSANGPIGAMLFLQSAGRTVMTWPPRVREDLPRERKFQIESALMAELDRFSESRNTRVIQSLLAPSDKGSVVLQQHGFVQLTRLIYLRRSLTGSMPPEPSAMVRYQSYSDEFREAFLATLQGSYVDSLDCPELNGVRACEDVLASHMAQGVFDPAHWYLARVTRKWAGCLLLAGLPEYNAIEVAYMGVVPHARGRRLGQEFDTPSDPDRNRSRCGTSHSSGR